MDGEGGTGVTAAADVASGYRSWLLWPVAFHAPYPRRMTPSGFLISSAEDMAHYLVAQLNGGVYEHPQLFSPSGVHALHLPASMGAPMSYGMGWVIQSGPGSTRIWHDGDVSNFYSHLLMLPDQHLGIVVLMNVGASGNSIAINSLVDGIASTLLGRRPAAPASPLRTTLSRLTVILPLLIAILWAWWSYRSLRRWRRMYVPLAIELSSVCVIWILLPAIVHTPMATIALFAPDAFAVVLTITVIAFGCATARAFVAFRNRRVRVLPADRALAG